MLGTAVLRAAPRGPVHKSQAGQQHARSCASHCCASLNALRCAEGGLLCAGEEPEALGLGVHGGHIGQWASPRLLLHSPLTLLLSADTLPTMRPSETPR